MFIGIGIGEFMFLVAVIIVLLGVTIVDLVDALGHFCKDARSWLAEVGTWKPRNVA